MLKGEVTKYCEVKALSSEANSNGCAFHNPGRLRSLLLVVMKGSHDYMMRGCVASQDVRKDANVCVSTDRALCTSHQG